MRRSWQRKVYRSSSSSTTLMIQTVLRLAASIGTDSLAASVGTNSRLYWYRQRPLLVQTAASIGTDSRLYWIRQPPLMVQTAASNCTDSCLYWFRQPPLLVQTAASIGSDSSLFGSDSRLYWYRGVTVLLPGWTSMQISPSGGWLVSALSITIREKGTIPLLTLTLTTITSMQLQNKQISKKCLASWRPVTKIARILNTGLLFSVECVLCRAHIRLLQRTVFTNLIIVN